MVLFPFGHRESFAALFGIVAELVGTSFEVFRVHFGLDVGQLFVDFHGGCVFDFLAVVNDIRHQDRGEVLQSPEP